MRPSFLRTSLGVALLAASGCELIADFDRSKIPGAEVDTGMPMPPDEDDAGADAAAGDAAASDDGGAE